MKQCHQLALQRRLQINHQVAAAEQIKPGERRVLDYILNGKDQHVANVFADLIGAAFLREELLEPLRIHIERDALRIHTRSSLIDCLDVNIRGKHLHIDIQLQLDDAFLEQHGNRVGFFTRGAARHPHPQRVLRWFAWQNLLAQYSSELIEGFRIAEKAGHSDQQFLQQQVHFLRVALQMPSIVGHVVELVHMHAPFYAAPHRIGLVEGKVTARLRTQDEVDFSQLFSLTAFSCWCQACLFPGAVLGVADKELRHLFYGKDVVDQAGPQRLSGHRVVLSACRVLRQHQPSFTLDLAQPYRSVSTHTGKNDCHCQILEILGQGAEEKVNRQPWPSVFGDVPELERAVENGEVFVGRNGVDVVRRSLHVAGSRHNRHAGCLLNQLVQQALAVRIGMGDQHKGHARINWHVPEEGFNRRQPTSGCAQSDNEEPAFLLLGLGIERRCPGPLWKGSPCGLRGFSFSLIIGRHTIDPPFLRE